MSPLIVPRPSVAPLSRAIWIAILLAPFAFVAVMDYHIAHRAHEESAWQVHQALVLESSIVDAGQLPSEGWRAATLPFRKAEHGRHLFSVWYRLEATAVKGTTESWVVYIPRPNGNYALSINGVFVADTDPMEPPLSRHDLPVLLKFSGALLHEGKNALDMRVVQEHWWPSLREIYLGPEGVLAPIYDAAVFWSISVKQVIVICMLMVSLMMAALYALRPRDASFGWYALALLFWVVQIAVQLVARAPFPWTQLWANIPWVALGWSVICGSLFVDRFVGIKPAPLERWYLYWGLLGVVGLAVDLNTFHIWVPWFYAFVWAPPILFLGINATWRLIKAARDKTDLEGRLFAVVFWWTLVVGTLDCCVLLGVLKLRPLYLTFVAGPVLLVFGLVLIRRFVRAADTVERARDELEVRVAERTATLESNLARLKDMERDQALSSERERIMRDMHDGVGGQLVQALSMVANRPELQSLEEPLRACLEELRLIIDSMEPAEGDLASVLGTLRTRMSRRLAAAGVQVHWQVGELPLLAEFGPQKVLQVTRIVQEAMVNALQSRQAKNIIVRAQASSHNTDGTLQAKIVIEVVADGSGPTADDRDSAVLSNMRRRAEDVGGQLRMLRSPKDVWVCLELPLNVAPSKDREAAQSPTSGLQFTHQTA